LAASSYPKELSEIPGAGQHVDIEQKFVKGAKKPGKRKREAWRPRMNADAGREGRRGDATQMPGVVADSLFIGARRRPSAAASSAFIRVLCGLMFIAFFS
jgi:hypothetical protein